jgi:hypothetical protein
MFLNYRMTQHAPSGGKPHVLQPLREVRLLLLLPLALLASTVFAAQTGPDFSKLRPLAPCAELKAAAQACQIPLEGLDPQGEAGCLNPGDSFTGLVTLCEKGGRRTQWLFYLTALPASPKSLAHHPPKPMVLYSGRSNRLEYASAPALVRLRTIGPFAASPANRDRLKLEDQSVTFALDKGFLGIGLEQAAPIIRRIEAARTPGAAYWFGSGPPNAEQFANTRKFDERLKLSLEEEHALGGAIPAFMSYAHVVEHVEVLQNIMEQVIEKPSLWSVIGHLGVTVDLRPEPKHIGPADLSRWGWTTNTPAYHFPILLELNHQLALTVTFEVTSPRPPLLTCGGILGMLAENPSHKETYLTLRVISARCQRAPRAN